LKISLSSVANFFRSVKKIILLIIIVSATTLAVTTIISIWLNRYHNLRFPSLGTIQVIGTEVYGGDINTTQEGIPFIDWGTVYAGSLTNCSFYIKSKSNTPITLTLKVSNLTFQNLKDQNVTENLPIENPLNLTWNYNNILLEPNEEIYVTLTLKVSLDPSFLEYLIAYDVSRFNFDIVITPSTED
jgi:hypothetical protein